MDVLEPCIEKKVQKGFPRGVIFRFSMKYSTCEEQATCASEISILGDDSFKYWAAALVGAEYSSRSTRDIIPNLPPKW